MTPVKWDEVTHIFENVVSVLLSTLNPLAQRIDGSGGDGGRDVQIKTDTALHIFECKSFTGRLVPGRRAQVKASLLTALSHQPDSWTLVVPIDPTPNEQKWFESLQEEFNACPINWLGKDWLDRQMIEHPAIIRYFRDGADNEVVQLLKELNIENTTLDGNLNAGIDRLTKLSERLNEIDPYYRIDFTVTDGNVSISHHPKWKGAELERPITLGLSYNFPDTEIGRQIQEDFEYKIERGEEAAISDDFVKVDTVSGPVGLVGALKGQSVSIKFGSSRTRIENRINGRLVITDSNGRRKSTIAIRFDEGQAGKRYGTLYGHDLTNSIAVSTELDTVSKSGKVPGKINLKFLPRENLDPHSLLPVLKFGQQLCAPNLLKFEFDLARPVSAPTPLTSPSPVPDLLIETVENLARIQSASNTHFGSPTSFSPQQVREIDYAIRLLNGEDIPIAKPAPLVVTFEISNETASADQSSDEVVIIPGRHFSIQAPADLPLTICGEEVYLGPGVEFCKRVEVESTPELVSYLENKEKEGKIAVSFAPPEGEPVYYRLIRDSDPEELQRGTTVLLDNAIE